MHALSSLSSFDMHLQQMPCDFTQMHMPSTMQPKQCGYVKSQPVMVQQQAEHGAIWPIGVDRSDAMARSQRG
eukprot:CAMPEP_0117549864 /NCGR_PEP_ID=MMETSP0784-20121206/48385_1 /TAXON_ID=39447 /ORGANISM="" /LENGTH=71 /DNA_ID=CAMNT_0005346865 /DNA_START=832 /DNA_END=1043 /DNA_ORIENTATION=-